MNSNFTSLLDRVARLVCGLLVVVGAAAARADITESYWSYEGSTFEDPASWNGPVPDETVVAIFDQDLSDSCHFNEDHVAHQTVIRTGHMTFNLWETSGEDFSYRYELMSAAVDAPSLVIGENPGDDASLLILNGIIDTRSTVIGQMAGSMGSIGFYSSPYLLNIFSCESHLHVGDGGQGLLDIDMRNMEVSSGSCVLGVQPGSVGEITVGDPTGSLTSVGILEVGAAGQGILTIGDGATVTSGSAVVAAASAATGDVTLSDANSSWTMLGTMSVGQGGHGTVIVSADADLTSGSSIIGQQLDAIGDVSVTGLGSSWTINGSLDVGYFGNGNLTICDGGAVFVHGGFVTIGTWPDIYGETGGVGAVTVCGTGSFWFVDGDLYVGFLWRGTLNVENGGTVLSQNGMVGTGYDPDISATVQGPGSLWTNSGPLIAQSDLNVIDGGRVVADSVSIHAPAELTGDGTIQGSTTCSGVVRVGDPVGALVVDGDFSTSGELLIDLAGADPGDFDVISVTGSASLDGALTVTLLEGYAPEAGDTFEIISAEAVSGPFGSVTLPDLTPSLVWDVVYDTASVELRIRVGDLDGDGSIGVNDFLLLLAAWGPCPDPCPPSCVADLDADCDVGVSDFLLLLANWG